MAIQLAGQIVKGGFANNASGTGTVPFSQDQAGAQLVSELNARYANLVLAGLVFGVQYAGAATAAASTTATGSFALFNPAGSGKNLILLDAVTALGTWALVTTAAQVAGLQLIPNQTPTAITPGNTPSNLLIGSGNTSVAKTYTAGTLVGAPTLTPRIIASFVAATAVGVAVNSYKDPIDGTVIIAPNSGVCIVSVASTPTIIPTLTWVELSV